MNKILISIAMFLIPASGFAANLADLQTKELTKSAVAEYRDYDDARLLKLVYDGDAVTANVTVSSYSMVINAPAGSAVHTIDFTLAAYDTLGELCDAVDAFSDVECSLVGGKRDDASILTYDAITTQSILGPSGYEIAIGTGGIYGETGSYINRVGITPQDGKRVLLKYCNVQNDGAGTLAVYGKLKKFDGANDGVTRNDTTLVASMATANDTSETNGNIYGGYWMEFAPDAHVVISAGNATTTQSSTSFLECFWDEK